MAKRGPGRGKGRQLPLAQIPREANLIFGYASFAFESHCGEGESVGGRQFWGVSFFLKQPPI